MTVAPYGSWTSPIDAATAIAAGIGLTEPHLDGDLTYWLESRAAEKGRMTIIRRDPDGSSTELLAAPWSARTRVHEYGGGAYAVADGMVIFSNDADGRVYRIDWPGAEPVPLTPDLPDRQLRYASFHVDLRRRRVVAVREDHRGEGEAVNTLVAFSLDAGNDEGTVLASGHDFIGPIAFNPSGTRAAWIAWDHPRMPWDGTLLHVADVAKDGKLTASHIIAGGETESVVLPAWSDDDTLLFVSDRTGWWNLYRWRDDDLTPLAPGDTEFAYPQWKFGMTSYAITGPDTVIAASTTGGEWKLQRIGISHGRSTPIACPYTEIGNVDGLNGAAVFIGASPTMPHEVVRFDVVSGQFETLKRSSELTIDPGYISKPEEIAFPTEGGLTAYGYYYAPKNQDVTGPSGEKPPLIVLSHGGPTGSTSTALDMGVQYWTSRGFAVLDVNYGGSTGYGRTYRERLNDNWGIVDVDDCINGAKALIERGLVDPERITIRGWSASGYTTLAALTFRDFFKAGASHFGISELGIMARETHKFESRYLDGLVGPYPEASAIYDERSPINAVDQLSCPLILFQGLEDKVVPPNQAEMMYEAVKAKGIPVAHVPFKGEQHGFRQARNIIRAVEGELYFLSRVFAFPLPEAIEPVEIANEEALPRVSTD
jgi:dipeptidyl aminopeptidase/acylaminoacyl peptidase